MTTSSVPSEDWHHRQQGAERDEEEQHFLQLFLLTFMPHFSMKTGENSIHITMM